MRVTEEEKNIAYFTLKINMRIIIHGFKYREIVIDYVCLLAVNTVFVVLMKFVTLETSTHFFCLYMLQILYIIVLYSYQININYNYVYFYCIKKWSKS